MEFDEGTYTEEGTNFEGWKKTFKRVGYKLPKIIFLECCWKRLEVSAVTKFDNDVAMVSGFFY